MARKYASILFTLLVSVSFSAHANDVLDQIAANPYKAGGVYYMYDMNTPALTPAPKGYTPFMITHYGRHGARYLYLESQNIRVVNVWNSLAKEKKLTPYGEDVYMRIMEHFNETHFHEGDLSQKGWDQHTEIARRMYNDYPEIFRKNPQITAMSTMVPRCIMSMNAFCSSLWKQNASLDISQYTSRVLLPMLNPHTSENPYREENSSDEDRYKRKDPWGGKLREFTEKTLDPTAFIERITTDPEFLATLRKPHSFMTDMFNFVLNMQCTETGVDLMDVFTPSELAALWEVDNYMYWNENGPLQKRDFDVVYMMISKAEKDIASGKKTVRLRFGHDSVLLTVLSTLGVNGMGRMPSSAEDIKNVWQNFNVPMGATFYMVFYKSTKGDGDILFKAVLNGKEATMPFTAVSGPYYKWEDLKSLKNLGRR